MDYNILSNEISQPQYAGMADGEIADSLNRPGEAGRRRVPIGELQARAMESGIYTALRVASASPDATAELRAVAQTVLDLANARFEDVDLDNAASRQMFGALQQARVITAEQASQIDALADVPGLSRAQELGLGEVVKADIQAARDWLSIGALRQRLVNGYNAALVMLAQAIGVPEWAAVVAVVEAAR